jgi:hypothetical protein
MRKYLAIILTLVVVVCLSVCGLYLQERIDTKKELDVLMNKVCLHATDYAYLIAEKKQLEVAKAHSMAIDRIRREVYTNKKFSFKQRQKIDKLISTLEKKEKGVSQWFFTMWDVQYTH